MGRITGMEPQVVDTLLVLNRAFYNEFAAAFSDSRSPSEPGFDRLVTRLRPGDRILDLGCGQARLARLLPASCTYTGVDYAEAMLAIGATSHEGPDGNLSLVTADLVRDDWQRHVTGPFDWIFLRAVLHHIPGYEHRQSVLARAAEVLAPGGRLVIANWQFMRIERLRRRVRPWATIGLDERDVEPGDYLLDWQRQGYGLRYAHLVDEAETRQLSDDAGLHVGELFYADGHTQDLTLYAVLTRGAIPADPQSSTR